ncbi:MBL fold metallo-hydrolase [Roseibium sp.]|uniref:MBL fold metallo-hydrolase n=1 Tax=Roseibium sp. TaxID=1936156 RepID=UPI003A97BF68
MKHDRDFDPSHGNAVEIASGIRRLTAPNAGAFTFHGTNTYLIGTRDILVIDPGPADDAHVASILKACDGARIEAILVSHTHMDHSPAAALLAAQTGAPIMGCGRYRAARELGIGESNPMDASSDRAYQPDRRLSDGETTVFSAGSLTAIETPGHTDNHLCFALKDTDILFSADHVMAWSTSIVAPPDGSMQAYMTSLEKLMERPEQVYLPGHGGAVKEAHAYMAELRTHRLNREASILNALSSEPTAIPELVLQIYEGLEPALRPAAALSVFAHLEDLVGRGQVQADRGVRLDARYRLAND